MVNYFVLAPFAALGLAIGLFMAMFAFNTLRNCLFYHRKLKHIPGTAGPLVLGDIRMFKKHKGELHLVLRDLLQTNGSPSVMWLLNRPVILTDDVDVLKTVWLTKNFPKAGMYHRMKELFGHGLLTSDGEYWKGHRRLMQAGFTPQQLRDFAPIFQRHAGSMVASLQRTSSATAGRVRIDQLFVHVTLDIIAEAALRMNLNTVGGENKNLGAAFHTILAGIIGSPLMAMPMGGVIQRWRYWRSFGPVNKVIYEAIANGLKDPPAPGAPPRDLLDILIANRSELSAEEIRDELFIFFLAGHETTALTLTWCLHELSQNPAVLRRLEQEVASVCGDKMPTADDTNRLPYMTQVLKETLRLHPAIASSSRTVMEDIVSHNVKIPAGSTVFTCIEAVHLNPEIYPDPTRFDPDRFTDENSASRHMMAWIPFTGGPRICIGMHFFWLEARILLARFIQHFTFAPVPGFVVVPTSRTGTIKPKFGLELTVFPRAVPLKASK